MDTTEYVRLWRTSAPIIPGKLSIIELPDISAGGRALVSGSAKPQCFKVKTQEPTMAVASEPNSATDLGGLSNSGLQTRGTDVPLVDLREAHRRTLRSRGLAGVGETGSVVRKQFGMPPQDQARDQTVAGGASGEDGQEPLQSPEGQCLTKLSAPIRKVHTVQTHWFFHLGERPINKPPYQQNDYLLSKVCHGDYKPPVLNDKLTLEIGDIFIHAYISKSRNAGVRQVWILRKSEGAGGLRWDQAMAHPMHPILQDRFLAFQSLNDTVPTWILSNTLRRCGKQPFIVCPGEEESVSL